MLANSAELITLSADAPSSIPQANLPEIGQALLEERVVRHHLVVLTAFGTVAVVAACFTTVIDWTVLAWRTAWLVVCIAAFLGLLVCVFNLFSFTSARANKGPGGPK